MPFLELIIREYERIEIRASSSSIGTIQPVLLNPIPDRPSVEHTTVPKLQCCYPNYILLYVFEKKNTGSEIVHSPGSHY